MARRGARSRRGERALAALTALGITALATAHGLERVGVARATECLARYEAPRGPERPDCRGEAHALERPAVAPWQRARAAEHLEELAARTAVADYVDAQVGRPDPAERARAAAALGEAEAAIEAGTRRLSFEALGPQANAPHLGRSAALFGDRATLLERAETWGEWQVRVATLEAALLEGDLARAERVAARYAEFDPRDEDLRTTVAAVLCLGADPKRGLDLFKLVEEHRAAERHAAMTRSFGGERAAIVACAARAGLEPPARPDGVAGRADQVEARVAQWLRLGGARRADGVDGVEAALGLLEQPLPEGSRPALVAALFASDKAPSDPAIALDLVRPRSLSGEVAWDDPAPLTVASVLAAPRGLRPTAPASTLRRAAARLLELADRGGDGAGELRRAAGALLVGAARAAAASFDPARRDEALADTDRGAELAGLDEAARALARSTACALTGDAESALAELDRAASATTSPTTRALAAVQRAELDARAGRADLAAASAIDADETATAADAEARAHARWTRLALAPPPTPAPPWDRVWPSAGLASPLVRLADPIAWATLERVLTTWAGAVAAPPDDRRALRYRALTARGDAPPSLVAHLVLAARLADGAGDVEVWLDAFSTIDARRFTLRGAARARAEAAFVRGDRAAAEAWLTRSRALAAIASDPARAELALYLGL
jgi:hypothetical protein